MLCGNTSIGKPRGGAVTEGEAAGEEVAAKGESLGDSLMSPAHNTGYLGYWT